MLNSHGKSTSPYFPVKLIRFFKKVAQNFNSWCLTLPLLFATSQTLKSIKKRVHFFDGSNYDETNRLLNFTFATGNYNFFFR